MLSAMPHGLLVMSACTSSDSPCRSAALKAITAPRSLATLQFSLAKTSRGEVSQVQLVQLVRQQGVIFQAARAGAHQQL
eukprot:4513722-Pleurochrysis_carterae.AAC.1